MLKPNYNTATQKIIPKVTALWAFSESGLGGILHAIKLPFSGIFLGSISVILISFLAFNSQNKWKTILQSFVIVLFLKFTISPHSPIMAYFALAFQAFLGAALFHFFGFRKIVVVTFGLLSLLESAFQKIATLILLFGVQAWEAITQFFRDLALELHVSFFETIPKAFIISYIVVYGLVGILIGFFAFNLPENLKNQAQLLKEKQWEKTIEKPIISKSKKKKLFILFVFVICVLLMYFFSYDKKTILHILIRSIAVILFFLYVINPFFKWILNRWMKKNEKKYQNQIAEILTLIPQIQQNATIAYSFTSKKRNPIYRIKEFLLNWIAISVYFESK